MDSENRQPHPHLSEVEARRFFHQLMYGLAYCHQQGICHRDLKCENLLTDDKGSLKISDFGLSALYDIRLLFPSPHLPMVLGMATPWRPPVTNTRPTHSAPNTAGTGTRSDNNEEQDGTRAETTGLGAWTTRWNAKRSTSFPFHTDQQCRTSILLTESLHCTN
mmetsp:Transcript_7138/g.17367  ORF Transcript_7138/g.17367 Transcript_7138/m.17367 type:complete len:163 (-) Transcript_7138:286-774(-)